MNTSPLSYGPFISRAQAKEQGLKYYFTGKQCKHGHVSMRTSVGRCYVCQLRSNRKWALNNPDYVSATAARYRATAKAKERAKVYRKENIEAARAAVRKWGRNNSQKRNAYRATKPSIKVVNGLRSRLRELVLHRASHMNDLIGCTGQQLVAHLEAQFLPGMNWDNYGLFGWHVDHIRPCASFDFSDPEQQRQCFHYTNLQPLWAADNLRKSDTWEPVAA
jgi:hypothetical protein